MSPAPWERGKSLRVTLDPVKHTRLVKEELVLQRMLEVCVLVSRVKGRSAIPEEVAISEEVDTAEKAKTGQYWLTLSHSWLLGTNLSTHHPPKWPWACVVSNLITKTSFPNALIPGSQLVSHDMFPYQMCDVKGLAPLLSVAPTSGFWMMGDQAFGILCFSHICLQ